MFISIYFDLKNKPNKITFKKKKLIIGADVNQMPTNKHKLGIWKGPTHV